MFAVIECARPDDLGAVILSAETKGRKGDGPKRREPARSADGHVASALRTAYEEAVREDVPPEFLELLGKLT